MKIDIRSNIEQFKKDLKKDAKHLPFATSKAINAVTEKAKKAIDQEINRAIDNPVAFTKKGSFISYSNKYKEPITAIVGIKDKQSEYLKFTEEGGISRATGKAKPVPFDAIKNKFGNIPKGKIKRMLSDKRRYFSGIPKGGNRPGGIYQRLGTTRSSGGQRLKMIAMWESETRHNKTTRFGERVKVIVDRNMVKELQKQIRSAIDSAK